MNKEGFGIVAGMILFTTLVTVGAFVTRYLHLTVLAVISFLLTGLVVYFFRDPERTIPEEEGVIVSPADGKVIEIKEEFEREFLQQAATRISIFMSVFDVHVNRIPLTGTVGYFQYKAGAFLKAYKSDASLLNEQTVIGIENGQSKILFKQIAGILARRIVCDVREGHKVRRGERFGIIKFGSRVDIFLPKNFEIKVAMHQKVKGGESIIGVLSNVT
ncbi:MAG: phosphatidylserine decarboxylase family protein [bacterium]